MAISDSGCVHHHPHNREQKMSATIPARVLTAISEHRPHLKGIVDNMRANPERAAQFEKAIADNYLLGETRLAPIDIWHLSYCCVGQPFGGGTR
jgi:hypothetical protein